MRQIRKMCWWLVVCLFSLCIEKCVSQIKYFETREVVYQIAGVFEYDALTQRLAFNESTRHANMNSRRLDPIIIQPSRIDSYSVWRELCKDRTMRPIAVFGPQNAISDGAVRDQCAIANIPHLQAAWQPFDPDLDLNEEETSEDEFVDVEGTFEAEGEEEGNEEKEENVEEPPTFKKITINFYPDSNEIALAYARLLRHYQWENFALLYEDDFGLLRIQKILAEHTTNYPITVRRLDPEGDNRKIFKELVNFQESRILLDCHVDRIERYMAIADELNMVNHYQHYILVSLDASLLAEKMTPYHSQITWLSLTDYDQIKNPQHALAQRVGGWKLTGGSPLVSSFQLEALIMDDMAKHVIEAAHAVAAEQELPESKLPKPRAHMCEGGMDPWIYGPLLQDKILKTKTKGVTGNIEFDETGRRVNYTLFVNEIYVSKRQIIGRWESAIGGNIIDTKNSTESASTSSSSKNFIVISRKAKPYFYDKEKCVGENCTGDDDEEYEGFSVDLVKAIFEQLKKENFSYTYTFRAEDKSYGKYDLTTKKWDGLIGDLLDKKADLAVCDLTITEERKKVVDFSVPFMSLGISILYTKEHKVVPGMFSFLNPYTVDVWMYTATAYCVVSVVLFICARISPADWENPQPCDKDPEELENIWNFKNCAWLTMGSIMTQGCDILPKALGTRWVCGMWWFFAVIVCQTYIAQLSASMTSALENEPINSVDDLAKQNKILYGAIDGGSTLEFFKSSEDKIYRTMYANMKANPVVLVKSNDEGERRVLKGKNRYAFLMESSTIEYKLKRNCELKKVGGELDSKDYGIAMPANSPFRSHINRAILKLKESTKLDEIKRVWWQSKYGAQDCEPDTDENDVEGDLEMKNLIGAFLVLIVGLVFCLFITAAEFMNEVRNIVVREQVTHKEAFIKELKASLNFFQLQKPVLRNPSRAVSVASSDKPDADDKLNRRAASIANFIDFEKVPQ